MIEGAFLAVVVVFLFLRDWRATFISALAIPLSAIPSFWFIEMMGFNLNQMTLLALSLVAGVRVDDAIVEIANILRPMRIGKSQFNRKRVVHGKGVSVRVTLGGRRLLPTKTHAHKTMQQTTTK